MANLEAYVPRIAKHMWKLTIPFKKFQNQLYFTTVRIPEADEKWADAVADAVAPSSNTKSYNLQTLERTIVPQTVIFARIE